MNQAFSRVLVVACAAALSVAGCATASKDLASTYTSPNQYASYDCGQLVAEAARIQTRVVQLGGRLDQAAQNDVGLTVVGAILFWPALFALGGTKQQEAEYSRLKGEYDAIEQASIIKKCAGVVPQVNASNVAPTTSAPSTETFVAASSRAQNTVDASTSPSLAATPAPSVIPIAAPTMPSSTNSTIASANATAVGTSKYLFNAERLAKDRGCQQPAAALGVASAGYETFSVACVNGEPMMVRCDYGNCRELK
jgi:hypothetical protein